MKKYGGTYYIGVGDPRQEDEIFFAGDISQICMWDRCLSDEEIKEFYSTDYPIPTNTKLHYDFSNVENDIVYDKSGFDNNGFLEGCIVDEEELQVIPNTTLPFRTRPGRFFSQSHKRNDMVGGKWVHQKDSCINERRFVEDVQGSLINTDEDGLTDLNYLVTNRTKHSIPNMRL